VPPFEPEPRNDRIRIVFDQVRECGNSLSISEVKLYGSSSNTPIPIMPDGVFTGPFGSHPNGQGPDKAVDSDEGTKMVDTAMKRRGPNECAGSILEFSLMPGMAALDEVTAYDFFTANDAPGRDPVAWRIFGKRYDGDEWTLLEDPRSGVLPTTSRRASYGGFVISPPSQPVNTDNILRRLYAMLKGRHE